MELEVIQAAERIALGEKIDDQLTDEQLEEAIRLAQSQFCEGCGM